jgi:hypothetical protein
MMDWATESGWWSMTYTSSTGGIFLIGGCYLVTAAGLTGVRASARAARPA